MGCCGNNTQRDEDRRIRPNCVLCKLLCIFTREQKQPGGDPCVVVPGHLIRKPDPCIYSQFMLMQLNQPVTWDNPDVRLFLSGVEQYTYNLVANTVYDVQITVHNASRDKPANGTSVNVNWIEFGAGSQTRHPIGTLTANVPVWPGTEVVNTQWRTPDTPGHYCIEVELSHPNDGNPANNRGWNNTEVHAANSPVMRHIRVFNRHPGDCPPIREGGGPALRPHRVFLGWGVLGAVGSMLLRHSVLRDMVPVWRFVVMFLLGYALMTAVGLVAETAYAAIKRNADEQHNAGRDRKDRPDCHRVEITVDSYVFLDGKGKDFEPNEAFTGKAPVWPAQVVPSSFVFAPGEAYRDVELQVDAPDQAGPPGRFNINVWQGGVPSGGVSITISTGGN